jgi:nucleoside 2-deoxyribosyltransferase
MRKYQEELERLGAIIESAWMSEGHTELFPESMKAADLVDPWAGRSHAEADLVAIDVADLVIVFTDEPSTTGGRDVEFGYAIASEKRIVVIGPRINVFHCLQEVEQYNTWEEFMEYSRW